MAAAAPVAAEVLPLQTQASLRQPVAAVWFPDQATLAVANRRGGTISLVNLPNKKVLGEFPLGKRLSDLQSLDDGRLLIAAAEASRELLILRIADNNPKVLARGETTSAPHALAVAPDNQTIFASLPWSRAVQRTALQRRADGRVTFQEPSLLPFDFAPGKLLVTPDGKHLVVADAFGGQLAVVELSSGRIVNQQRLDAHNIQGLAWDAAENRLLLTQQMFNSTLPTTEDNILWGVLMKNLVRVIPGDMLLDRNVSLNTKTRVISLGQDGHGGADPAAIVPLPDGMSAVTLAGAQEVALVTSVGSVTARIPVGRFPAALVANRDATRLIALNQFDDSLSIIDVENREVDATLPLGKLPLLSPAERGERLFHDARLSFNGWMSCHSCHTRGHTNGLLADTEGDGNYGAPKRVLSLFGVRDTDRWAWNGQIQNLHDQVRKSITSTMHGTATADEVFDLTAYLHTLDAPPPLLPAEKSADDRASLAAGRAIFEREACHKCHVPPLTFTSPDVYDVGLADELGQRKFNPPSLRGVSQNTSFFHDGRAKTLAEVFSVYGHPAEKPLKNADLDTLLRYLRGL